jgi:hypothetical protein
MDLVLGLPFTNHVWEAPTLTGTTSSVSFSDTTNSGRETIKISLDPRTAAAGSQTLRKPVPRSNAPLGGLVLPAVPAERPPSPVQDMRRLYDLVGQLGDGLAAIHAAGMLHCDIKPSNVLVTPGGRVMILDFGIAQSTALSPADVAGGDIPGRDRPRGTPTYMSPEQALTLSLTPATDSYAVGAMLYEAITGELPFDGSAMPVLVAKQSRLPPRPSELRTGVPDDLDDLIMRLLSVSPADRPTTAEMVAVSGFRPRATRRPRARDTGQAALFEGRARELAAIGDALERTSPTGATPTTVVHVSGPSGMGKSSLIARFVASADKRQDTLVLSGRSYERESVPFKAFDPLVDGLTRQLLKLPAGEAASILGSSGDALALVFPVLRVATERFGLEKSPDSSLAPHVLRRRAFEAFRSVLRRLGAGRRLVVVMDDLHWGDTDSARLLEHLLSPPDPPPMLLVLAYRRELSERTDMLAALDRLRATGAAGPETLTIDLAELDEREAFDVAFELLRARGRPSADIARAIATASGGHPFFLGELVEHTDSDLERQAARAPAVATIEDALMARVRGLSQGARELLELLSVAGGPLDVELALRAAGLEHEVAHLGALRAARLATTLQRDGMSLVHTAHDRIRETVAGSLTAEVERARHAALAAALAASPGSDEEALARHLFASGDTVRGREHALAAAASAEKSLAFLRAAALYAEVVRIDGPRASSSLHRRHADALSNGGRGAEAGRAYLAAARALGPDVEAVRTDLLRLAAEHLLKSGRGDEGVTVLREVLSHVGLRFPSSRGAATLLLLARRTKLDASLSARIPAAAAIRARFSSERAGALARARADVTYGTALGLSMFDVLRGAALGYQNLEVALQAGEPMRICRALCLAAAQASAAGTAGRGRAERFLRAAREVASGVDDAYTLALPKLADGNVRFFMGEWRAALGSFEEAEALLKERCLGVFWETTTSRFQAINALIFLGELRAAAAKVGPVVAEAYERSDEYALKNTIYPRVIAAIVGGTPELGRRAVEGYVEHYDGAYTTGRWGALMAAVTLDRYDGEGRRALARIEADEGAMRSAMLFEIEMIRIFSRYEHALCALAAAGGRRGGFADTAHRLGESLLQEKPGYAIAMGHKVLGGAALVAGDKAKALEHVRRAVDGLERSGLRYIAACARYRRGELLGGAAGEDDRAIALRYFDAQGVASPADCVRTSFPGAFA